MSTIVVGMSGGVDSTVAAYLLREQGFSVIGVYMKNWEEDAAATAYRNAGVEGCSWEQDMADVRAACEQLRIPFTTFNFVEEYRTQVFKEFVSELEAGRTPNPDILCNQEIKFRVFLEKALQLPDVDAVATGHYAKIQDGTLVRPADRDKDQTYFLYRMPREALSKTIFPLADLTKAEVRAIAEREGFVNAHKKDSTGICFIGEIDYRTFVDQYVEKKPGKIVTVGGAVIGDHQGLHFYTIGQRRGIDIGGDGPYYVVEKRMDTNELVVTNNVDDPLLSTTSATISRMHWLVDAQKVDFPFNADVQIRYRQDAQPAVVSLANDEGAEKIQIEFQSPQRAVTPGQSAVIYVNNTVYGGGIIE
jgi:tRNA-uridine 2-sulfurtransferase